MDNQNNNPAQPPAPTNQPAPAQPQQPVPDQDSTEESPLIAGATKPEKEGLKSVIWTAALLLLAPLIAYLLTVFVFQSYEVDGPSMESSLQHQDRLIVLKAPKTIANLTGNEYIPQRGEIIIFSRNEAIGGFASERQLVKRVVGLPGDRVVVKNGDLTVFNTENPKGFSPDKELEYGEFIDKQTPGNVDITVGENEVFVAGDNRDNSLDSRAFGAVSSDQIVGKLGLRIYPFNKVQLF